MIPFAFQSNENKDAAITKQLLRSGLFAHFSSLVTTVKSWDAITTARGPPVQKW